MISEEIRRLKAEQMRAQNSAYEMMTFDVGQKMLLSSRL